jgi:UDP-2,3-diacylglucosamine hydrolase
VILILSDLHLGKVPASDKQSLGDLRACIEFLKPQLKQVVFLGDTFDAFIEYPGRLPQPVRLWTSLANELIEIGIDVTYFAGNHDRWHLSHIQTILNVPVFRLPKQIIWRSKRVWLEHGDLVANHAPTVRFLRYISDRPWAYSLYRTFLPFGLGHVLASEVSRKLASFEPDPLTVEALRSHAESLITNNKSDLVVMGHCHFASLESIPAPAQHSGPESIPAPAQHSGPESIPSPARHSGPDSRPDSIAAPETSEKDQQKGLYVNTGDWYEGRTFVTLTDRVRLNRWTSNKLISVSEVIF